MGFCKNTLDYLKDDVNTAAKQFIFCDCCLVVRTFMLKISSTLTKRLVRSLILHISFAKCCLFSFCTFNMHAVDKVTFRPKLLTLDIFQPKKT